MLDIFFSSRRRHTRWTGDWSSDVCSSDLRLAHLREDAMNLLLEMEFASFAVVPLPSNSEQFDLATWQGRDVPSVGVAILNKDETITAADIERLMPFATQAGDALVRASDVERLRDSSEQHAIEKEWLFWMINSFADPVIL